MELLSIHPRGGTTVVGLRNISGVSDTRRLGGDVLFTSESSTPRRRNTRCVRSVVNYRTISTRANRDCNEIDSILGCNTSSVLRVGDKGGAGLIPLISSVIYRVSRVNNIVGVGPVGKLFSRG